MHPSLERSDAGLTRLREAVAAEVFTPETDSALITAVGRMDAICGESLEAIVFFGSRRTGAANANAWSAYDWFAVVSGYGPFFAALGKAKLLSRSPRRLALLARWLPPTQISLGFSEPGLRAKVSVIEHGTFLRETSPRRRDHFTIGRLFQPSRVLFARTPELREAVLEALVSAYVETWGWARPWLPGSFDADAYGRAALATSMSWEVRPEPAGRAAALWSAQCEAQRPILATLLRALEGRGVRRADGGSPPRWRMVEAPGAVERLRLRLYFCHSLLRATTRWAKHMLTFEGWLEYIVRKASRHTGETIELSERERRWPIVFLWPRVVRYLRRKDRKGTS